MRLKLSSAANCSSKNFAHVKPELAQIQVTEDFLYSQIAYLNHQKIV